MKNKKRVFIGLGSNVGKRLTQLRRAAVALGRLPGTRMRKVSAVYETSPVGPHQPDFLNAVAQLDTCLDPLRLLMHLQSVEKDLGRKKRGRWGPREIDLDLIFYGDVKMRERRLRLPHPRWNKRKFVVWPLAEIAPRFRDPKTGRTTARQRRKLTDPDQRIKLYKSSLL